MGQCLSLTSRMGCSIFIVISNCFESADKSVSVWDRLLPSDLPEILSRAVSPVTYATKKELYMSLCHSPVLLDGGKLSFCLEETSGNKCYMVGARGLWITWLDDTSGYWEWTTHPDSRFSEVAQLKSVCWLEIKGGINTRLLSWKTIYGAYLVFKLDEECCYGLESANAFVRFLDENVMNRDVRGVGLLHLQLGDGSGQRAAMRGDGWMEVEMGSFYNDGGDDGDVEVKLLGIDGVNWKSGLIVQGIEFRPKPI